ncbi:MAG: hypothetical protein K2I26_05470 [Paramuribaculum sp.]|nr:hypothetical protein [Paramuribaculum sp.]
MKKYVYMVMAIIGLSVMPGCKDDEPDGNYDDVHMTWIYDFERLVSPDMIYRSGSEFMQSSRENVVFNLSDKEFLGRSYLQINIGDMPTEMLIRVDGDVIWGYNPQTESEFKMYDFSKWPLEEGDSLIYRIYEINDNYEITGIADYSDVLKSNTRLWDFLLGDEPKSRCTVITNYEDNIYEDSKPCSILAPYRSKTGKGIYSYYIWCEYYAYDERFYEEVLSYYIYNLNFGMAKGKGLFFKDESLTGIKSCEAFLTKLPSL